MKSTLLLSSALCWLIAAPSALAQSAPRSSADEEIVVTGSVNTLAMGAPASDLEVPFSTTGVSAEIVERQGGVTLQDALRNVPGAQADFSFTGIHAPVFTLRGAIADSGTGNSRILRDGVRLSNYGYAGAFVDHLDVVRGAGAVAAVRSEPGGTVNIVTKAPELENAASLFAQAGSESQAELYFDGNYVISADRGLATRLIVTHSAASEWRGAKDELDGVKWSVLKSDGDRYRVLFDFEGTDHTYEPDFGIPGLNGRPAAVPRTLQLGEPFADSTTDNRIYTLKAEARIAEDWRIGGMILHADGRQTSIRNSVFSAVAGQLGVFNRVTGYEPYGDRDTDSLQGFLTGVVQAGGATHNFYLGAEYQTETLDLRSLRVPAANSPSIDIFNPVFGRVTAPTGTLVETRTTLDVTTRSVSVQDRIDFGRFGLVLGGQFVDQEFLYGTVGVFPVQEERFNPKIGATYTYVNPPGFVGDHFL